jgi:hypothetical protein
MGRLNGTKNRRAILKEAEQHIGSKYVDQVVDSLYVIEKAMRHFYMRAEMGKNAGRKEALVDQDYKDAATLAALVAPFRHARLSAMKLAGDPNNPARFKDDATADELRAELMKRLKILISAGLIDLKALPVPGEGISAGSGRQASARAVPPQSHLAACLDRDCKSSRRRKGSAGNLHVASPCAGA